MLPMRLKGIARFRLSLSLSLSLKFSPFSFLAKNLRVSSGVAGVALLVRVMFASWATIGPKTVANAGVAAQCDSVTVGNTNLMFPKS